MSLSSIFESIGNYAGQAVNYAVSNETFNDVITGAAIGAGISWMKNDNILSGAAFGGAGGFLANKAGYDLTDMLFDSGISDKDYTDSVKSGAIRSDMSSEVDPNVVKDLTNKNKGLVSRSMDYLKDNPKVAGAAVSSIGSYLTEQAKTEQLVKAKKDEMKLQKKLDRIQVSNKKIAPWASKK